MVLETNARPSTVDIARDAIRRSMEAVAAARFAVRRRLPPVCLHAPHHAHAMLRGERGLGPAHRGMAALTGITAHTIGTVARPGSAAPAAGQAAPAVTQMLMLTMQLRPSAPTTLTVQAA